jgi:hypothetical protein
MADLGTLAAQGTPLASELGSSAGALGREFTQLTPFATAARNALIDLGASAARSQGPLVATVPLAPRLDRLGTQAAPAATLLDRLTASLDRTGAIRQLMAVLFYGTAATNGFDSLGHYVRDELLVSDCTGYATSPVPGCSARFPRGGASAARDASTATAIATSPATGPATAAASTAATATANPPPTAAAPLHALLDYLIGPQR